MSRSSGAVPDPTVARSLGRARIRAGASISIDAPVERVWMELIAVEDWGDWYRGVTNVRGTSPLVAHSRFRFKAGPASIDAVVDRILDCETLRFTGSSPGARATYEFRLQTPAGGEGTDVTAAQTMGGVTAMTMKPLLQGVTEKAVLRWLEALKERTES